MKPRLFKHLSAWLPPAVAVAALLVVYMAYQSPDMVMDMANRLWACF